MKERNEAEDAWEAAGYEGSRRLQLRRARELTLRERLEAVEQMNELSDRLQSDGASRASDSRRPHGSE